MTTIQIWIAAGVGCYMAMMLGVGFWASKKVNNTADYIVAGRRLPLWMAVGTTFATWFGAETCMGSSGTAYHKGLLGVIIDPFGAALCLILTGLFFARTLYRLNMETIVDFFDQRFGQTFGKLSAALYIPVYMGWIGGQLLAFGIILETLTGLPRMPSVLIATAVVLIYTYSGGMWADTVTDVFQMGILLVGFLIMYPMVMNKLGGFATAKAQIPPDFFHLYPRNASWFDWANYAQSWMIVGLGSIPAQDLIQRIFASKNERVAQASALVSGFMYLTIGLLPVLLGIFGRLIVPAEKGDSVLIELILGSLPAPLIALMVGALLSAIMSSADSAILSPASIIGNNLMPYFKKGVDDKTKLAWCKFSVPVIGIGSLLLALYFQNIYKLCQEAWTLMLVSLVVPLVAGLYWKRATGPGAVASALAGVASWILLTLTMPENYPHKLFAFLISAAAMAALSLLGPQSKQVGARPGVPAVA
ncbi:MAG: sodium:solute symporter family protein [Elusimicrobia bacterium]|nr:sodium:solute symporter family protein [Elusimicrobiota bacterium]